MNEPSPNGDNGRDAAGRFQPGNPGGPGNPFAKRVAELRSALLEAVGAEDVKHVVKALADKAKGGDVAAAKVLLDRLFGQPKQEIQADVSHDAPKVSVGERIDAIAKGLYERYGIMPVADGDGEGQ